MPDFDLARRAHVYKSLDAELASIPDFLAGATTIELAHDLANADAILPEAEEITADVQAWLERQYSRTHPSQLSLELWEDLCNATED